MSFRFTIGKKIGTGFGVLILFIIIVFGATFFAVNNGIETFRKNDSTSNNLIENLTPSKEKVMSLRTALGDAKRLAIQWVSVQSRNDTPDKERLNILIDRNIPDIRDEVRTLSVGWKNKSDVELFEKVEKRIDTLFGYYKQVMSLLPDNASYDDGFSLFTAKFIVGQNGDATYAYATVDQNLLTLENSLEDQESDALQIVKKSSKEASDNFESLTYYWILGGVLIIFAILIAIFTTNTIVKPTRALKRALVSLGKGIFPKEQIAVTNDEIGDMSRAMIGLVDGLKKTTDFAREVGQSNFSSPYKPLSEEDVLGHALLKMRDELAETERILEQKVKERTEEVVKQRDENERQRLKLEDLYKDVTDSIRYAKRLQYSILPADKRIEEICPDSFVLFKPKDIVSGDFYWFDKRSGKSFCAAVDCTGHGVPGAFMSLVGANGLNAAVREHQVTNPGKVLSELNKFVSDSLNKGSDDNDVRDGMDLSFCAIDYEKMELEYAGANNPLYLIRNNEFTIIKADKFAIGSFEPGAKEYASHKIALEKGDVFYLFSDGYADQFGGDKGKKFLYKHFRDELMSIHQEPMANQKKALDDTMKKWQGAYEQVDDILVIGVRI
jgi:serine phosphatase RsbU (regulator of sigma subunit)/HAMP domain-containing protein